MASSRFAHLEMLHTLESTESPEFESWSRTRLDRMLADYMLRKGYAGAAETLVKVRGIEVSTIVSHVVAGPRWQPCRTMIGSHALK